IHPENGIRRVKKKEGRFTENWKRVYRESTDDNPEAWLNLMSQDGAFDDLVRYCTAEVPQRRDEYLTDLLAISKEIEQKRTAMRRSGCFRYSPCGFSRLCNHSSLV